MGWYCVTYKCLVANAPRVACEDVGCTDRLENTLGGYGEGL